MIAIPVVSPPLLPLPLIKTEITVKSDGCAVTLLPSVVAALVTALANCVEVMLCALPITPGCVVSTTKVICAARRDVALDVTVVPALTLMWAL